MLKRPKVLLGENFLFGPSLKLSFFLDLKQNFLSI